MVGRPSKPQRLPVPDPSVEVLRHVLGLDPETGRLTWLHRPREMFGTQRAFMTFNSQFAGKEAFTSTDKHGYRRGAIFGRSYLAHRVVFAMVCGYWHVEIDHRDGNPSNNRPGNLRDSTRSGNTRNRKSNRNGTSQFKGVSWLARERKWIAQCYHAGRREKLGYFDKEIDAALAYDAAAIRMHREFARLNFPNEAA